MGATATGVRAIPRSTREQLFEWRPHWWSRKVVRLFRLARAGQLWSRPREVGTYDGPVTVYDEVVPDGDVYELETTGHKVWLSPGELEDVATEFYRLRDGDFDSIAISIEESTISTARKITIYPFEFAGLSDALGPYARAPLAAEGAYR